VANLNGGLSTPGCSIECVEFLGYPSEVSIEAEVPTGRRSRPGGGAGEQSLRAAPEPGDVSMSVCS
jgi:hypothetical protein